MSLIKTKRTATKGHQIMNHSLQVWNATEAQQIARELVQQKRHHTKTVRKLETKLGSLIVAMACRQLGLRRGTTVRLIDPQKESVAALAGLRDQIFVVEAVTVFHESLAALLRLAGGKKASPRFTVSLRAKAGKLFYVHGTQTTIARDLRREKPARC